MKVKIGMQRAKGTSFTSELQYIDIEFCIWHIYNIFSTFSQIVFLFFLRIMHTSLVISSSCLQKEIKSQRNFAKSEKSINLYLYQFITTCFESTKERFYEWKFYSNPPRQKRSIYLLYFIKKKELQILIIMLSSPSKKIISRI